jgi:hypothetical protein
MIENFARSGSAGEAWFNSVLLERRANKVLRLGSSWSRDHWTEVLFPLLRTRAGTKSAVAWALEETDEEPLLAVIKLLSTEPPARSPTSEEFEAWMSGEKGGVQAIDDSSLEQLCRRGFASNREEAFPNCWR